jgi:hypothetical protein
MHPIGVSTLQQATVEAVHALVNGADPGSVSTAVLEQLEGRYRGIPAVAAFLGQPTVSGGRHAR